MTGPRHEGFDAVGEVVDPCCDRGGVNSLWRRPRLALADEGLQLFGEVVELLSESTEKR